MVPEMVQSIVHAEYHGSFAFTLAHFFLRPPEMGNSNLFKNSQQPVQFFDGVVPVGRDAQSSVAN